MAFRVEIAPRARDDIDRIAAYITAESSFAAAEKWFNGVIDAIASLRQMPTRCRIADESKALGQETRLLLHGPRNRTYKIYFAIRIERPSGGVVRILHVRHWARRAVRFDELQELIHKPPGRGEST
jgi:plasmid stabilization system protein ParE